MGKNVYVSSPLVAPKRRGERDFYRADLQFQGLDHSNASYEGRVFLNNARARLSTPTDPKRGYVGSYFVFGHAGCWGDEGHCDIPPAPLTAYDLRPPHQLTPQLVMLPVTEQVKALSDSERGEIVVSVVAVPAEAAPAMRFDHVAEDVLRFERVVLVTYEW